MIDPKKELFKWGPIDSEIIYMDSFLKSMRGYSNYIKGSWPNLFAYFKDKKVTFVVDNKELRQNGLNLFNNYVLNDKKLKHEYIKWSKTIDKIKSFEKKVNKGLYNLTEKELKELFISWNK